MSEQRVSGRTICATPIESTTCVSGLSSDASSCRYSFGGVCASAAAASASAAAAMAACASNRRHEFSRLGAASLSFAASERSRSAAAAARDACAWQKFEMPSACRIALASSRPSEPARLSAMTKIASAVAAEQRARSRSRSAEPSSSVISALVPGSNCSDEIAARICSIGIGDVITTTWIRMTPRAGWKNSVRKFCSAMSVTEPHTTTCPSASADGRKRAVWWRLALASDAT